MYYFGPEFLRLFLLLKAVGKDDDPVAFFAEPGGGAAQGDLPFFADNRVGFEAIAVVKIKHVDLFAGSQPGGLQQGGVNGDTAFIIKQGGGDGRHVYL